MTDDIASHACHMKSGMGNVCTTYALSVKVTFHLSVKNSRKDLGR